MSRRQRLRRRPKRFGSHIPANYYNQKYFSSSLSGIIKTPEDRDDDDDDDCPICKFYSRGPCGPLFQSWLSCTEEHPGVDEMTGQERHLEKCHHLAQPLAQCLEDHADWYNKDEHPLENDDQDNDDGDDAHNDDLKEAWNEFIISLRRSYTKPDNFPEDIVPQMEVRLETKEGVAAFAMHYQPNKKLEQPKSSLVFVYLEDQTGQLLGAGSLEDIMEFGGFLRFGITSQTETVTANAFYMDMTDNQEKEEPTGKENGQLLFFARTERLPPR